MSVCQCVGSPIAPPALYREGQALVSTHDLPTPESPMSTTCHCQLALSLGFVHDHASRRFQLRVTGLLAAPGDPHTLKR